MVALAFHLTPSSLTPPHLTVDHRHRMATTIESRGRSLEGSVVELRGGDTIGGGKTDGNSSAVKGKGKGKGKSKTKSLKSKKGKKSAVPTLWATIRAFVTSLLNPRFVLKLEAKQKDQVTTVHGTGSTRRQT
ncbi:unnamed protein product [Choristocarpus tenellus]